MGGSPDAARPLPMAYHLNRQTMNRRESEMNSDVIEGMHLEVYVEQTYRFGRSRTVDL